MVEISKRRDDMGPCMDPLYRFKAWFIALVPIGLVPDGLRLEPRLGGRVVDGELAGAILRGGE